MDDRSELSVILEGETTVIKEGETVEEAWLRTH